MIAKMGIDNGETDTETADEAGPMFDPWVVDDPPALDHGNHPDIMIKSETKARTTLDHLKNRPNVITLWPWMPRQ